MRWIYDKKIIFVLLFLICASSVYALRITRPSTFQLPWTEEQVTDLNYTLQQLFLMQDGRFELDYQTTTKPNANDGEFWLYTSTVATIQYMANDTIHECLGSTYSANDRIDISGSGQVTLNGAAKVWKNEALNPAIVKLPGVNPAAEDTIDNFLFDRFDKTTEESVFYTWVVPDDFAEGNSSLRGHFVFLVDHPPAVGNVNVRLGFEYKKISYGDVFDFDAGTSTGYIDETIVGGETAYILHTTSDAYCTTTGWQTHDKVLFRFFRAAGDAADTYDDDGPAENDVWMKVYHLEYLVDKLGEPS